MSKATGSGSIRVRIALALVLFGVIASLGFGGAIIIMEDRLEATIMDTAFAGQVAYIESLPKQSGQVVQVSNHAFRGYLVPAGVDPGSAVPEWVTALAPGFHEAVPRDGRRYDITVQDRAQDRIYLLTDVTSIEREEARLASAVMIAAVLFVILSWFVARQVASTLVGPLNRLAERVGTLEPSARYQRLPEAQGDASLQQIASGFNRYLARIDAFIEREQNLTNMVSHELRTPLAVVSGAVDVMLDREREDAANRKTLTRIKSAATRMSDSVDALLLLARERRELSGLKRDCRVDAIVRDVIAEQQPMIGLRPITLETKELEPTVIQAPVRLVAMLVGNLLSNALRYTERGTVRVSLADEVLRITDTGVGMPEFDIGTLQRPPSGKIEQQGEGFGLYIVHTICELLGWRIAFEANPGGGTIATVTFRPATSG